MAREANSFFEGLRIIKDLHAEKHRLDLLFENVASMDGSDRDLVSHYLGVRPVVACASGLSQVRRKMISMGKLAGTTLGERHSRRKTLNVECDARGQAAPGN